MVLRMRMRTRTLTPTLTWAPTSVPIDAMACRTPLAWNRHEKQGTVAWR